MMTALEITTMLAKQSLEDAEAMLDQGMDPDFLIGYLMGTLKGTISAMERIGVESKQPAMM